MFKSATFKLTMWYLAIVMVISFGFSVAVYHFATNELTFGLNSQTQRIYRQFPVFTNNPYLQVRENDISLGAHHIFLKLVYFNILVLAAAGYASYLLARRTLKPIEAAHDAQKRFTADVSHELRTPLTALKMGSEVALLDKQASKQELQDALKSNVEEVARMELLINNLLRLTKLDSSDMAVNFGRVDSTELVAGALEQVQRASTDKNISIVDNTKNTAVMADASSLTQLLVILLDNAIKYSPDKSEIVLSSQAKDGQYIVEVKDQGQGISREALPHIFERFYREDSARTTSTEGDGYGLGLSIAKMIADRNNSTITITSTPKKGTTAAVAIPLATS
jgi:signal transduction histidine kinase